jgi:hypothetical protein
LGIVTFVANTEEQVIIKVNIKLNSFIVFPYVIANF